MALTNRLWRRVFGSGCCDPNNGRSVRSVPVRADPNASGADEAPKTTATAATKTIEGPTDQHYQVAAAR